jgi:hypothetical protein
MIELFGNFNFWNKPFIPEYSADTGNYRLQDLWRVTGVFPETRLVCEMFLKKRPNRTKVRFAFFRKFKAAYPETEVLGKSPIVDIPKERSP